MASSPLFQYHFYTEVEIECELRDNLDDRNLDFLIKGILKYDYALTYRRTATSQPSKEVDHILKVLLEKLKVIGSTGLRRVICDRLKHFLCCLTRELCGGDSTTHLGGTHHLSAQVVESVTFLPTQNVEFR
jgi:hypothetical protein